MEYFHSVLSPDVVACVLSILRIRKTIAYFNDRAGKKIYIRIKILYETLSPINGILMSGSREKCWMCNTCWQTIVHVTHGDTKDYAWYVLYGVCIYVDAYALNKYQI